MTRRRGSCGSPATGAGRTACSTRRIGARSDIARMRHDGGGGRGGKVELLTGIEGVSSRLVRRIVLLG